MRRARLTLYGRGYCHLCDDMRAALAAFETEYDFCMTVIDVDADPALVARYDEQVPVLTGQRGDGLVREICHYFLDSVALEAFFTENSALAVDLPGDRDG